MLFLLQAARIMSSEAMVSFLRKVAPCVEQSLQQNETVDIFQVSSCQALSEKIDPFIHESRSPTTVHGKRVTAVYQLTQVIESQNESSPTAADPCTIPVATALMPPSSHGGEEFHKRVLRKTLLPTMLVLAVMSSSSIGETKVKGITEPHAKARWQ